MTLSDEFSLKLTPRERLLLTVLQHRGNATVPELRSLTKLREHTIRYTMGQLTTRGILCGRSPFFDVYRLGLTYFVVAFSCHMAKRSKHDQLLEVLRASPQVSFLGTVGGEYQYFMTVCAQRVDDVVAFLDGVSRRLGSIIMKKSVGAYTHFYAYGRKYLWTKAASVPVLEYGNRGSSDFRPDKTDTAILSAFARMPFGSFRDLATLTKLPPSTVLRRIRNLEREGVINGHLYYVDLAPCAVLEYKILLHARGTPVELTEHLQKWCRTHPHVVRFITCFGGWDYEVDVEVTSTAKVTGVVQELLDAFGAELSNLQLLQLFTHEKFAAYPFRTDSIG